MDWQTTFAPAHVGELIVRGSLVYLGLLLLLRFAPNRKSGAVGMTDLVFVVVLVHAAHNALVGEYKSLGDGAVIVLTILAWSVLIDWAGFHVPAFRRFVRPSPRLVVKDGRLVRRNLWRELITEEELMSQLRVEGIDDLADVKAAHMESDGRISVVRRDGEPSGAPARRAIQ